MSSEARNSKQHNAKNAETFIEKIKIKLITLHESRREDDLFRSFQNEPYIDVWCERVSTDEKDQESQSLKNVVLDFLRSTQHDVRTLAVFGESGSGKSNAMVKIEEVLWDLLDIKNIGAMPQFFPVFMILKTVSYPMFQNMPLREIGLHSLGNILTMDDLAELEQLKSQLKLSPVWLLDGFDEIGRLEPICTDLYKCGISIVTCRQQFLDSILASKPEKYLTPKDSQGNTEGHFEQVGLLPLAKLQVEECVKEWIEVSAKRYSENTYDVYQILRVINTFPSLKDLSSNPYLLMLLCTSMPTFSEKHECIRKILKTSRYIYETDQRDLRFAISDMFKVLVDAFIAKGISRFAGHFEWTQKKFDKFPEACQHFCENAAFRMYKAKEITYMVDMSDVKDNHQKYGIHENSFPLELILQSVPFRKVGNSSLYTFPHKSLWEYFLTCRSMRLPAETLGLGLFTQDRDLLLVHAEVLAQRKESVEEFIQIVLSSRQKCDDPEQDKMLVTAASNALSILNFAAADDLIPFKFEDVQDWKGIRVPGVNLNHAKIIRCEFDGSDLSGASLVRTFVAASSFKEVDLRGAIYEPKSILLGHTARVNSIAFHGGSEVTLLGSGSEDKSVRIWDVETGECIFTSPQAEHVWDSPMGSIVAFTSRNSNCIFLWDTITKKFYGTLEGHTRIVECFCFSPDGKIGASGSEDGTVRIWNIAEKSCSQILRTNSQVNSVTLSPDANKVASATSAWIHIWDLKTGNCMSKIKTGKNTSVLYSNGNNLAISNPLSSTIQILDTETGEQISSINVCGNTAKISSLPNGFLVILANCLKVWDIESNTCWNTLEEKNGSDSAFALSRDLTVVVTVSSNGDNDEINEEGGSFRIWDLKTFEPISSFKRGPNIPNSICISHDNSFLVATYSRCSTFSLWDMKTGEETKLSLGHIDNVKSVAFRTGSSSAVLASSSENDFRLWDRSNDDSWKCFHKIQGGVGLSKMTFSPDCKIVVGWDNGKFVVFDRDKNKVTRTLSGISNPPCAVFSPDGHYFVCLSDDRYELHIFETATWEHIKSIHTVNSVSHICFSPDGQTIAYGTFVDIVLINWRTGQSHIKIRTNSQLACFHPTNNRMLASLEYDKIKLWDACTGECLLILVGHIGAITSVCFTNDEATLVSGGVNGSILLWDLTTNQCLPNIGTEYLPYIGSVCLSYDGRTLVAAGEGLCLYDVQTGKLVSSLVSRAYSTNHVSFNSDDSLLLYSMNDEMIEIWDLKKKKPVHRFSGTMPCFSPDSTKILYLNDAICVWNVAEGKNSLAIDLLFDRSLKDVCFSPEGSMIVASYEDIRKVYFWNAVTGKRIKTIKAFWEGCRLAMSPKGNIMAFSASDILEIWNLEKSKSIATFHGCKRASFSADGSRLACNRNKSVVLYDMETMKLITTLEGHTNNINYIYYHPGGRFVVSCCECMIFIWDLEIMQPHTVIGANKTLQLDCNLQNAKLDASFRKMLSNLSVHLFSTRIDEVNPNLIPYDKEQEHIYFENDEEKSE